MLLSHRNGSGAFDLIYGLMAGTFVVGYKLWDRRYRRNWRQFQSRNWPKTPGRFDAGEIVTMLKGRSRTVAGYELHMDYLYAASGEQWGTDVTKEFNTEEEAETWEKRLRGINIPVRVAPNNPKKSLVCDEDA